MAEPSTRTPSIPGSSEAFDVLRSPPKRSTPATAWEEWVEIALVHVARELGRGHRERIAFDTRASALEKSVGGPAILDAPATGFFKALGDAQRVNGEQFDRLEVLIAGVLDAVNKLSQARDADQTAKLHAIEVEAAKNETLQQVRAPWSDVRKTAVNALVILIVTGLGGLFWALLLRHLH